MDLNKDWLGLGGVALGWGLNQCGQWLLLRRDERKAIGRALADLLELRHRLLAVPIVLESMAKVGMPSDARASLRVILATLIPKDEALPKRYEESVNLVAANNPTLAYRLRSQDMVGPILQQLRDLAAQEGPQSTKLLDELEDDLLRQLSTHLERLIRELAKVHGLKTRWQINRRLREPLELPEEFWRIIKAAIPQPPSSASGAANSS